MQLKYISIILLFTVLCGCKQPNNLDNVFHSPPESAKPWTFWYWRKAAVSKEGITADLEAMKEIGLGGAYLIPLQGVENPPLYEPSAIQLTPYWWELIKFSFEEAKRLDLKLAMHACDGFAVAGGPWITPELSMQKVVWSDTLINGGNQINTKLPVPENYKGYYKDIAVFAMPVNPSYTSSTRNTKPTITTSLPDQEANFLATPDGEKQFRSFDPCYIQYTFNKPFTCRSILVHTRGNNLQSHRLTIKASNDGNNFQTITQLQPARHGWQDYDAPITHAIKTTTAKFFRFYYNREGTGTGGEDNDAAKFSQSLKLAGIELFGMPRINQYEGKNGIIWRISKASGVNDLPDSLCFEKDAIFNLSCKMDTSGIIHWDAPEGQWLILRMGHTSTGHTNYIGGAGLGLECDKFSTEAAAFQFENWFGQIFEEVGNETARQVLKIFHTDSWEVSSQNWSSVFPDEFKKRRGYDPLPYMPIMAGIPIENAEYSEDFLSDVRTTISELVVDNFFGTMADLARKKGCLYSAESIAPTFVSDGMLHYKKVDIPMGEFWHNSPTHDKPNDMLDAIYAAHVYGKKIIQAESFTTLRMAFNEHPGMLKPLLDRNYALGINKVVFHVMMQNPWMDRQPGMTLDGVGLYFQRDQIWWDQANVWIDYMTRCQALLQNGVPVADIAVFTGEEIPRRALTPDRLVDILPGLFDTEVIGREKARQLNHGIPYEKAALDVTNTVNTFKMENWIDPLNGYQYDCINKDALINLAKAENGRVILPGGASYGVLVIPGKRKMEPNYSGLSEETTNKIIEMAQAGIPIIWKDMPQALKNISHQNNLNYQILHGKFNKPDLTSIGLEPDCFGTGATGRKLNKLAWCHRSGKDFEIYFISNQMDSSRQFTLSLRAIGKTPNIYNPVAGMIQSANNWRINGNRTELPLKLEANASVFIVLEKDNVNNNIENSNNWLETTTEQDISTNWKVSFNNIYKSNLTNQSFDSLTSWSSGSIDEIKYYSGKANYSKTVQLKQPPLTNVDYYLEMEQVCNIATVSVNGTECGTVWTPPYRINITDALQEGNNKFEILVSNTWLNRLLGDYPLADSNRYTWTTAPYRFKDLPLEKSGLLDAITITKAPK